MNSLNVPKLRFPRFDREWEEKKLGNLGEFKGGGTPSTTNEDHWNGNIPWISSSDIYDGNLHEINIHRFLNEVAINESATKIIPANSILLVSRVGVGKLAINKIELCTSQDFCNFIPNKCNSYFVGYFLISRKQILINFSQGTSIKGFTTGDIKTLPVTLPTLSEQQKIASFLSSVDEKIRQLSRKKKLLEQYKKGVMQQLFSGKLRFKHDNGKDYPDWEEKKLGEVAKYYDGTHQTPNYVEAGIPFYSVEHVTANQFLKSKFISEEVFEKENKRVKLEKGDILMTRIGDIGTSRLIDWDVKASFYVSLALIKQNDNYNSSFLNQYISSINFQKELWANTIHVAFPKKINLGQIGKCKINFPSLPEQQKIANFLSGIDGKIEQVNGELVKTQEFKKGLLQQMFV